MELSKMSDKIYTKKLLGTSDRFDEQEFSKRVKNDPKAAEEFRLLQMIWEEAGKVQTFGNIDVSADWKEVNARLGQHLPLKYERIHWRTYFLKIAAMLILTSGLSIGLYKLLTTDKSSNAGFVTYNPGKQIQEVRLPDGSIVTLNAGAKLSFRDGFGVTSREVILDGEAFFNVIPGSKLPFKVYSGESVVEVTGTSFSVYEIDGMVHVSVLSGKVMLSSTEGNRKEISISANQSGFLSTDLELKVEEGIPANVLSWKTGQLSFERTPIDTALLDIARHFRKELTIATELRDRITAEFQNQPLSEILDELTLVAGLRFDTTGTALIVRK